MSTTVRTCAWDGATYAMGDACPMCGARHSTADLALERLQRDQARLGDPTEPQNRPLPPLAQQLDLDGGRHDLAPQTRQERLFEPAPFAQLAGQQYLDTKREDGDR